MVARHISHLKDQNKVNKHAVSNPGGRSHSFAISDNTFQYPCSATPWRRVRMFDIKSYVILLNEVFVTGNSDESLTLHINTLLEAEQEPIKPHGADLSTLCRLLNSTRIMYAFTKVMNGKVSLAESFREHFRNVSKIEFNVTSGEEGPLLVIQLDGTMACAVSPRRKIQKNDNKSALH